MVVQMVAASKQRKGVDVLVLLRQPARRLSGRRGGKRGDPPLPWREKLHTAKPRAKVPTLAEWYAEKRQRAKDWLDPTKWGR
jgi:hypothetical protein